ncbi:6-phosphogluconate phosphatase [Escherichia coli]|uniref:6-phosphogluconate phosphatase n=1 Tax=Escherichia coli TaxID=562 RepID=A0A376LGX2_ECOLX|nr:6-phosphogluconate phosphatase [Escherichia coli]
MSQIEAVFFDCDGTLVDSEVICSRRLCHDVQGIWHSR